MTSILKRLVLLSLIALSGTSTYAQIPELFKFKSDYLAPKGELVTAGTRLVLNRALLQKLYNTKPAKTEIRIPLKKEVLVIELEKNELFSYGKPDIILASTLKQFQFKEGYYVRGKIKGKEKSFVALSIFEDGAGGVLSFDGQNYNLCVANTKQDFSSDDYLLYSEKDYHGKLTECKTLDDEIKITFPHYIQRPATYVGCPLDMYFELSKSMYDGLGDNPESLLKYFTILFNAVQTLYTNESILVQIREIKIWDVTDPEAGMTSSSDALTSFKSRMNMFGFNGDLAHFVTFDDLGGGVAYRDVLCSGASREAVSGNLVFNYKSFPVYSFSVNVITHETGHNIGSPHTHNCTWPGGPIDDCAAVDAGPCPAGPTPAKGGGTMMSYCHLKSAVGIDFANGFGPLPGDLIRLKMNNATTAMCICTCSNIELDIATQDIGCGNPTGSAAPVIKNGTGPFKFLWNNGSTDSVATGLVPGTYYVKVTGVTSKCTVIKGCKILSNGNAITTTLSPSATSVSKCINETYPMSASASPAGSYSYQWYKDNVAISGAVNTGYTATSSGNYFVKVNNATCLGQSSTVNVLIQNIAPFSITAGSSTSICSNDSVRLSIPATNYSVEWLFNGTPISGATSQSYYARAAGDYAVRLYLPGSSVCQQTSSVITVTQKAVSAAVISPAGNVNICQGKKAVISNNAVNGNTYQWYKDGALLTGAINSTISTDSSGTYQLFITSANGCMAKSSIANVIVNPLPDSSITPLPSFALCEGGTLKLTVRPVTDKAVYNWYKGNQFIGSTADSFFNVKQAGSYSVVVKNSVTGCESSSDTTDVTMIPPPTIFAGNDTILATGQPFMLHAFETSDLGVTKFDWSPATGLDDPGTATPVTTLFQDQLYTVKGTHPLGCYGTAKIKITVYKGPAIYVPGAFSPNKDGKNDVLKCFAVGLLSFKSFSVFNRSGERVFVTANTNVGWDGTYNGKQVDIGTYIWVAEGIDYKGNPMIQKGTLVILR